MLKKTKTPATPKKPVRAKAAKAAPSPNPRDLTQEERWAAQEKLFAEMLARHSFELTIPPPSSECPLGWAPLVDDLLRDLVAMGCRKAAQIKSKFATLTVFTCEPDPKVQARIDEAWKLSARTCEWCGAAATQRNFRGWWWTLCPLCFAVEKKRRSKKQHLRAPPSAR